MAGKWRFDEVALRQPYGFAPLDVQTPALHFMFETTVPPLFGGVTGGLERAVFAVGPGLLEPVEPGTGVPPGVFGLTVAIVGPGFGAT